MPVIYISSEIRDLPYYKAITTNGDLSFSGRLRTLLENTDSKYFLFLLEDYLVDEPIAEEKLEEVVGFLDKTKGHYCQIFSFSRRPRSRRLNKEFGVALSTERYRLNLQPSIISRELLTKLADTNPETPWDGEINLMRDEFKDYKAYISYSNRIHVVNYIEKGWATRKGYKLLIKTNRWKNQRSVMPIPKTLKKALINRFGWLVPTKIRQWLKGGQTIYKG